MEFASEKRDNLTLVTVTGRMDAVTAPGFEEQCLALLEAGDNNLVADLGGLEYISSAGLRSILSTAKKLKAAQGSLAFCNLKGMVQEVFTVSGFASMFPIHATVEDALKG